MSKYSPTFLDNLKPGNAKGRKAVKVKGRLMPIRVTKEWYRPYWRSWWRNSERVGLRRDEWYKPKGNSTKRGNKRGQSKPR